MRKTDQNLKFKLFGNDGKRYRQPNAEIYNCRYITRTVKHVGGVNVYGCFSSSDVSPIVDTGKNVNALRLKGILERLRLPFLKKEISRDCLYPKYLPKQV